MAKSKRKKVKKPIPSAVTRGIGRTQRMGHPKRSHGTSRRTDVDKSKGN